MNNLQAEVQQLKDNSLHSKKRVFEMMMSLLKDLGDIGSVVGGNTSEFKVGNFGNSEVFFVIASRTCLLLFERTNNLRNLRK